MDEPVGFVEQAETDQINVKSQRAHVDELDAGKTKERTGGGTSLAGGLC